MLLLVKRCWRDLALRGLDYFLHALLAGNLRFMPVFQHLKTSCADALAERGVCHFLIFDVGV